MTDKGVGKNFVEQTRDVDAAKAAQRREQSRVDRLIAEDRISYFREQQRKAAELEVREGVYVNLDDSVVEPTKEWLAKGNVEEFTPKQHDNTVRSVKSVRRTQNLVVQTLHTKGKLTDDQFAACLWFRDMHEQAGMHGRWPAVRYEGAGGGGSGGGASVPMARHEYEAYCRMRYREAREAIDPFYRVFFDNVVIHNIPANRAGARCRRDRAPVRLKEMAQCVVKYCEARKIKLSAEDGERVTVLDRIGEVTEIGPD